MISRMRNCVTSEAVSDLVGKASTHPEKVSTSEHGFYFSCWRHVSEASPLLGYVLEPDVLGMRE